MNVAEFCRWARDQQAWIKQHINHNDADEEDLPMPQSTLSQEHAQWLQAMSAVELPASPDFEHEHEQEGGGGGGSENPLRPVYQRLLKSQLMTIQTMRQWDVPGGRRLRTFTTATTPSLSQKIAEDANENELCLEVTFELFSFRTLAPLQRLQLRGGLEELLISHLSEHVYCLAEHYARSGWQRGQCPPPPQLNQLRLPCRQQGDEEWPLTEAELWIPGQQNQALSPSTPLSHLTHLPLGQPLLLLHRLQPHGDLCPHPVVIHRLSVASGPSRQVQLISNLRQGVRRRKCRICDLFPAQWLLQADAQLPESPCHLCTGCLGLLHYDEGGQLRPDASFTLHPYYHEL